MGYTNEASAGFSGVQDDGRAQEGEKTKAIESMTRWIPSSTFLWASLGSIVASAALFSMGRQRTSVFVGQWAPTFLILGLYNKVVKLMGHEGRR